jgi:hypothetical protein
VNLTIAYCGINRNYLDSSFFQHADIDNTASQHFEYAYTRGLKALGTVNDMSIPFPFSTFVVVGLQTYTEENVSAKKTL